MAEKTELAKRFNEGKLRLSLVPQSLIESVAHAMTDGAKKYGARNWEKGFKWDVPLDSLDRHLGKWKKGEDIDGESGLPHLAHVAANLAMLIEYSTTFKQGDHRTWSAPHPRISLDLDGVLADFHSEVTVQYDKLNPSADVKNKPVNSWYAYDLTSDIGLKAMDNVNLGNLKTMDKIIDRRIEGYVACYVTNRPARFKQVTEQWLFTNNFPQRTVHMVDHAASKAQHIIDNDLADYHIDDSPFVFVDAHKRGLKCFLIDAPYNRYLKAGKWRVSNFTEVLTQLDLI